MSFYCKILINSLRLCVLAFYKAIMKKILILCLLFACISPTYHTAEAENIVFEYDDAGNCVLKRKTVVLKKSKSAATQTEFTDEEEEPQTDILGGYEIIILPNPTKGMLRVEIKGGITGDPVDIMLLTTVGKTLKKDVFSGSFYTVDLTSYPAGVYILRLTQGREKKEWKIVKE